jgi:hypothetical protein
MAIFVISIACITTTHAAELMQRGSGLVWSKNLGRLDYKSLKGIQPKNLKREFSAAALVSPEKAHSGGMGGPP